MDPTGLESADAAYWHDMMTSSTIENEVGRRNTASQRIDRHQEILVGLQNQRSERGILYQKSLETLGVEYREWADTAGPEAIDESMDVIVNGLDTLYDVTPEFAGFDWFSSVIDELKGLQERKEQRNEFISKKFELRNEFERDLSKVDFQIETQREIIQASELDILEADRVIEALER